MSIVQRCRQAGLTMIELLIALAIGAILVLGVVQIFLSGQQSARLQNGFGTLQDGGRIGVFFLHQGLRVAGLPRESRPPFFQTFVTTNDPSGNPATRDGAGNAPDVITVMYQSDTNCVGGNTNAYGAGKVMQDAFGNFYAKDQYFLDRSVLGDNSTAMSLRCRALDLNNASVANSTAAFVEGIEDMQFLYGVDRLPAPIANQDFQPDAYLNATQVTAAGLWNRVVSLRFAILATSIDNALDVASPVRHRLLDAPAHPAFTDRQFRRVFRSTMEIRNQTP